ncbi:hypothetical protein [Caudoviricetes sp.]|nr:hypothetical protein [Caudoviricetes sp.]UOF79160.1 hypothetical protein [Caudoviricetes sp.]
MSDDKKLKAQLDQITAAQSRTQLQLQALNHKLQQQPQQQQQFQYQQPPQQEIIEDDYVPAAVDASQVAHQAAQQAASMMYNYQQHNDKVRERMERLVGDFPALTDEGSELVNKARGIYKRVTAENPSLDDATKYELAVREAASYLGARPVTIAPEDAGWTMGNQNNGNPSLPSKNSRSRLTTAIIQNAQLMGINVDPKSKQGQLNLSELSEYSARFNADRDETHVKYK